MNNDFIRKEQWLVCGSRSKKSYKDLVFKKLDEKLRCLPYVRGGRQKLEAIIEGECPDSADVYAKAWAEQNNIPVRPFPAVEGSFLKRNIEMVGQAYDVTAFWDKFSYGTCHTIATAILQGKSVTVIEIIY